MWVAKLGYSHLPMEGKVRSEEEGWMRGRLIGELQAQSEVSASLERCAKP